MTTLLTEVSNVGMKPLREWTTLYLRGVPAGLVREAKAKAARRGSTLTALAVDALARSLGTDEEPEDPFGDELRASMAWYARNRAHLLERHRGEYVAIVDRKVIDHDREFEALASRVFESVGVRPVYMPRVQDGEKPLRVRSPRRVRP